MPPLPPDQAPSFEVSTEPASVTSARPKLPTRGERRGAGSAPFVALLSGTQTARYLDISTRTLTRWVKQGIFPKPVYLAPGSPAKWRVRDLDNWISKCAAARRPRPALRGALAHLDSTEAGAVRHGAQREAEAAVIDEQREAVGQ